MNTEYMVFLGVVCFIGLFFGWFFRNGITFWAVIAIGVFSPILVIISNINFWPITLAFIAGFLVHTWKPIYRKLQEL